MGRNKEWCKGYRARGTREDNQVLKQLRHEKRMAYFAARNERLNALLLEEVGKFMTISVKNSLSNNSASVDEVLVRFYKKTGSTLPRGRVRQFIYHRGLTPKT